MNKRLASPFLALMAFVLIVSLACSFSTENDEDATKQPQVLVVTATPGKQSQPEVTTEAPVVEVTDAPMTSSEPQPYFLEEFDTNMDNYSWFNMGSGDADNKMELYFENGQLKFELNDFYLWPYITYDAYTYTDVRIDVEAENLGVNQNSVTMICRYDESLGWYEFNIANDGTWYISYYDAVVAQGYTQLYNGGSTAINMGRDTNVYTAICQGQDLTLYINGVKTRTVQHKDLKEGLVGIGVSSYENTPVNVFFNWMEISEP